MKLIETRVSDDYVEVVFAGLFYGDPQALIPPACVGQKIYHINIDRDQFHQITTITFFTKPAYRLRSSGPNATGIHNLKFIAPKERY